MRYLGQFLAEHKCEHPPTPLKRRVGGTLVGVGVVIMSQEIQVQFRCVEYPQWAGFVIQTSFFFVFYF